MMPNYIISWTTNKVVLRNYEGIITTYEEPDNYKEKLCDRECNTCDLDLNIREVDVKEAAIGIEKLLSNANDTISLIPEDNERLLRRNGNGNENGNGNGNGNENGNRNGNGNA